MSSYLQQLIRKEMDEGPEPAPRLIANRIIRQIPDDKLRECLDACLYHEVREAIRRDRNYGTAEPPAPRRGSFSPRMARYAHDILRERYYTGTSGWLFLGDCTPANVAEIVAEYQRRANEQIAYADRFRELQTAMIEADAETVSDLPVNRVLDIIHPNPGERESA